MPDVRLEAQSLADWRCDSRGVTCVKLPCSATCPALQVGVRRLRKDMELLATLGRVAVTDVAQLLEDVEGAVDGGGVRVRVPFAAEFNELTAGDVAAGLVENLQHEAALGCHALPASMQRVAQDLGGNGDAHVSAAVDRIGGL